MSHSFTHLVYHIVTATKERRPSIDEAIEPKLYAFLGDLIREERGTALAVNGMPEHVHLLALLPPSRAVSDVVRAVKANSSAWLSKSIPGFAWQTGYGAFTVSKSVEQTVWSYIENQKKHHAERSYLDEFRILLKAQGFDPAEAEKYMD